MAKKYYAVKVGEKSEYTKPGRNVKQTLTDIPVHCTKASKTYLMPTHI